MAPADGVDDLAASVLERVDVPSGPLLVALSGGADSAVLAWVAMERADNVRAVFVDHALPASAQLRVAAAGVAARLELALDVVPAPVDPAAPNLEETARGARYRALEAAAKPGEWILTGHTSDDQAETVLGNVLRGAGLTGLAGIPARRHPIARPLLAVSRTETRALAEWLRLPYLDDPANESPAFRRNRIRRELMPQLESEFNPQLRETLRRTAEIVAADDALLDETASVIPITTDGDAVVLPAPLLVAVPDALARRAVRRALRAARGPHPGTYEEVAAVMRVLRRQQSGAELGSGWRVEREGPMLALAPADGAPSDPVALRLPGSARFDRWTLEFNVTTVAPPTIGAGAQVGDADVVGTDVVLSAAGACDRIEIGTGTKAVADALAEAGVPRRLRARWPVLVTGARVAMIPGVRTAAWAWRGPGTMRYLVARIVGPVGEAAWNVSETY